MNEMALQSDWDYKYSIVLRNNGSIYRETQMTKDRKKIHA